MKTLESTIRDLNEQALTEAVPTDPARAARALVASLAKFNKQYAMFEKKSGIPAGTGHGDYGKLLDNMDQKVLQDTIKAFQDAEAKWEQFNVSAWAMRLRGRS